jgi:GT2 family glycosyltransferase
LRTVAASRAAHPGPTAFHDRVRVTQVLQFFNKRRNIPDLVRTLRQSGAEETIVCDDGSADGSMADWMAHLTRPNDFVLRANDLFEVRTYDRCISLARGEFVVLLQDDDVAVDGGWLRRALDILGGDERVAIVGGRAGQDLAPGADGGFVLVDSSRPMNAHGWRYVAAVNRAPWIVRKRAYEALGGIDQGFAPFQHDDADLCLRAWLGGWRVAQYHAGFVRDVGGGGMRLFNGNAGDYSSDWRWRKAVENWRTLQARYATRTAEIGALVEAAAQDALSRPFTGAR